MPPMDKTPREAGGDEGKSSVALCVCIEEHMRVRKLLTLLHTIAQDESCSMLPNASVLANACWDTTSPEAIPAAAQANAADHDITDDAATAQLPVNCVCALLMHGASPDHCGADGQTALEAAITCKNVAAVAALCSHGADASAYASQEALNGLSFAADAKDKRISSIQEILKQHSATGKGSASEAAQLKSRSMWLRLAARICWVHNAQASQVQKIQRRREPSRAPDAALVMPVVQSFLGLPFKSAADMPRVSVPPFCPILLCACMLRIA